MTVSDSGPEPRDESPPAVSDDTWSVQPVDQPEIAGKLKAFIEDKFPNPGIDLEDTTDLLEDWFVDSLGIIETVFFMETTFDIRISRADVNGSNFQSIATLSEFVASRVNA